MYGILGEVSLQEKDEEREDVEAQMIQVRKDARQSGLPHYRPGRPIRTEKNTKQQKHHVGENLQRTQT